MENGLLPVTQEELNPEGGFVRIPESNFAVDPSYNTRLAKGRDIAEIAGKHMRFERIYQGNPDLTPTGLCPEQTCHIAADFAAAIR